MDVVVVVFFSSIVFVSLPILVLPNPKFHRIHVFRAKGIAI